MGQTRHTCSDMLRSDLLCNLFKRMADLLLLLVALPFRIDDCAPLLTALATPFLLFVRPEFSTS